MIGGNVKAVIETCEVHENAVKEHVTTYTQAQLLFGYLDMATGGITYSTYNAKIVESTHVFICDYVPLAKGVTAEHARMIIDGQTYDVTYIDDPMGLHAQLEIYLKYTGGR